MHGDADADAERLDPGLLRFRPSPKIFDEVVFPSNNGVGARDGVVLLLPVAAISRLARLTAPPMPIFATSIFVGCVQSNLHVPAERS